MYFRNLLAIVSLAGLVGLPGIAAAQRDDPAGGNATGIYLGGGVGRSTLETDLTTGAFDESDTAWKAFLGYHLDFIPVVKAAVEVGWRDLGNPAAAGSEVEVRGWDYSALAGFGLGPVELFGRLGRYQYDFTASGTGDADGSANLYGVGLSFVVFGLGVRAEYEKLNIDELDDARMASVSVLFQF
jgi:hypothetical protein